MLAWLISPKSISPRKKAEIKQLGAKEWKSAIPEQTLAELLHRAHAVAEHSSPQPQHHHQVECRLCRRIQLDRGLFTSTAVHSKPSAGLGNGRLLGGGTVNKNGKTGEMSHPSPSEPPQHTLFVYPKPVQVSVVISCGLNIFGHRSNSGNLVESEPLPGCCAGNHIWAMECRTGGHQRWVVY